MSFSSLLNSSIMILKRESYTNDLGEKINTWISGALVAARLIPISVEERVSLPGEYRNARYKAILPSSANISESDRVLWNNKMYDVIGVYSDSTFHHKVAILRENTS